MPADGSKEFEETELAHSAAFSEDRETLDRLFSLAYEELRRLAASVRRGDPSATLSPTALVNEAWLKLSRAPQPLPTSPLHFKRIAARAMRQLLIDAARRRSAQKRGAGPLLLPALDSPASDHPVSLEDVLALEEALVELARMNPRQASMVELRFFGGLDVAETAAALEISEATVERDWRAVRAWLARRIGQGR